MNNVTAQKRALEAELKKDNRSNMSQSEVITTEERQQERSTKRGVSPNPPNRNGIEEVVNELGKFESEMENQRRRIVQTGAYVQYSPPRLAH
jgi:hypothetical protein